MKYLFEDGARAVLMMLARERTLCAFDFDGTLSRIVDRPEDASLRPSTREWLRRVAELYPCAVISGRARVDVAEKLIGVPLKSIVGNHGAEYGDAVVEGHPLLKRWREKLESQLLGVHGVHVEDKGLSLAVHYRASAHAIEAKATIMKVARGLRHARIFGGKKVVNLVPDGAPDKGDALVVERERLACDWALFVGDDDNDEEAFLAEGNVVGVRVGWSADSGAQLYLKDQCEVDELLEMLVSLRAGIIPEAKARSLDAD